MAKRTPLSPRTIPSSLVSHLRFTHVTVLFLKSVDFNLPLPHTYRIGAVGLAVGLMLQSFLAIRISSIATMAAQVERTRSRPLASGILHPYQAVGKWTESAIWGWERVCGQGSVRYSLYRCAWQGLASCTLTRT